jgi:hypothetical protein
VAARSKAWVCVRSLDAIVGSNPFGGMDVCCECYVLSGRGFYFGLITRPKESCRLWCVVVCDLETSKGVGEAMALVGPQSHKKNLILRRNERDVINVYWSTCKVLIIPVRF